MLEIDNRRIMHMLKEIRIKPTRERVAEGYSVLLPTLEVLSPQAVPEEQLLYHQHIHRGPNASSWGQEWEGITFHLVWNVIGDLLYSIAHFTPEYTIAMQHVWRQGTHSLFITKLHRATSAPCSPFEKQQAAESNKHSVSLHKIHLFA